MPAAKTLHATLLHLEQRLFLPEVRRSQDILCELLAVDFMEVGATGCVYDRAAIIAELSTEYPARITLSDFRTLQLAPDAALATYRATITPLTGEPPRCSLRCSVWKLVDGRWQMLFHQGTPVRAHGSSDK